MSEHHILRSGIGLLCAGLFLMGCSSEKRLGESRVEHRRYNAGWHVNVPNQGPAARPIPPAVTASMEDVTFDSDKGPTVPKVDWSGFRTRMIHTNTTLPERANAGQHATFTRKDPPGTTWASRTKEESLIQDISIEAVTVLEGPAEGQGLPDAVYGRHPLAVPGFILSLGWLFGFIGALALEGLGTFNTAYPLALGFIASVAGYLVSRKSYRMSRSHPEQYPRGGLSRVARWLSVAFLAPIALYLVLIILFVFILGGW